ncbi:hypothetical protein Hanom_Chr15g01354961 [Helianthus anomalus]
MMSSKQHLHSPPRPCTYLFLLDLYTQTLMLQQSVFELDSQSQSLFAQLYLYPANFQES